MSESPSSDSCTSIDLPSFRARSLSESVLSFLKLLNDRPPRSASVLRHFGFDNRQFLILGGGLVVKQYKRHIFDV